MYVATRGGGDAARCSLQEIASQPAGAAVTYSQARGLLSLAEIKNIIDKLAQFVARNGPEFETMTKQKQKDNPKFSFLFGGEYFNYYQYKVTTEQASEYTAAVTARRLTLLLLYASCSFRCCCGVSEIYRRV